MAPRGAARSLAATKLYIGNKTYSSWSLRGWLACRQSGLAFDQIVIPMYGADWRRHQQEALSPSGGKVPMLRDGDAIAVWDSLAIVDYLADKVGRDRFWPADDAARAMARSIAAEMHSSFAALRSRCSMNVRREFADFRPDDAVLADLSRITTLWDDARRRFGTGGAFLFGDFGAADIMYAPVCTRIVTYRLPVDDAGRGYVDAVLAHPFMRDWIAAARDEPWTIDRYEEPTPV